MKSQIILISFILLAGCATKRTEPHQTAPSTKARQTAPILAGTQADHLIRPGEKHFKNLRQLTHAGENAEAYWSFDGSSLILQARGGDVLCDQIYRLDLQTGEKKIMSTGTGRTTCAYWFPDGKHALYSSTHETSPRCPPPPNYSRGYVWPLYDAFNIYQVGADGSGLKPLITSSAYDAEATICQDGSIIFTSTRDGDLELYKANSIGTEIQRLTFTPGYDGGAFFSKDCSKIVWRASRFNSGAALKDYQQLLADGLVRPSKLEVFVMNADGSNPVQITSLDAASFAPFFFPDAKRVIFASNVKDPKGRNFDLFSVGVDKKGLEQITFEPTFDSFPIFSPDGKYLAFSSNRGSKKKGDTNVFIAEWVD